VRARRAALALLLVGCAAPPPKAAPSPRSQKAPRSPDAAAPRSLLQRRDAPPPGVSPTRQGLFYGIFGWGACPVAGYDCVNGVCTTPASLKILTPLSTVSVLEPIKVCVLGLGPPLIVEVRSPAGQTRKVTLARGESGEPTLVLPPGPPGAYTVTVTGGERWLSGQVQVKAADRPRIRLHPQQATPGSRVHLALVGFAPNRRVEVRLYGPASQGSGDEPPPAPYITTLTLHTTAEGQAERALRTDPSDGLGHYFLVAGSVEGQLELVAPE